MSIRESLARAGELAIAELQRATADPDTRSVDRFPGLATKRNAVARSGVADKHYPEKSKLRDYWELYREIPIIRDPIRSFASEVVEPGYYIDSDNEQLKEDVEDWLKSCAIVDGEVDRDFSILLKKATIQREVKGTALSEKVLNERDDLYGFKLMRPETVRMFTKPGQSVLLPPDFDAGEEEDRSRFVDKFMRNQKLYETDDDEVAAYVQLDDAVGGMDNGYYIPFTRDEVIKLTRDADVGSVFGESRLAAVEDRLQALLKKLRDNDKAIESLAHPFQLFLFGSEDAPWEPGEIQNFMDQHKQSNFEPGMKQGVQGDVSIETVSGEVAPIEEFLDFDLNWILSEMPMPKYSIGAWESDVNQFVSRSQSARLENQIQEARKEIEKEWTPVIEQKVEEMGYDVEDFNAFIIGEDPEELNLVRQNKQIPEEDVDEGNIPDGNNSDEENVGPDGTNFKRPPASTEDREGGGDTVPEENELTPESIEQLDRIANNFPREDIVEVVNDRSET
jgi:hypothetical protein